MDLGRARPRRHPRPLASRHGVRSRLLGVAVSRNRHRSGNPAARVNAAVVDRRAPDLYALVIGFLGTVIGLPIYVDLSWYGTLIVAACELGLLILVYRLLERRMRRALKVWLAAGSIIAGLIVLPVVGHLVFPAPNEFETAYYSPFEEDGDLKAALKPSKVAGHCWEGTVVDTYRTDRGDRVYRCVAESRIEDPCFPRLNKVVVCADDPWSEQVVEVSLTSDLPEIGHFAPEPGYVSLPWGLELSTGERCTFFSGTSRVTAGIRQNYACDRGRTAYDVDIVQGTARVEGQDVKVANVALARVGY